MLDQPALEKLQGQLCRSYHGGLTVPFQQPQLWDSHVHEKQRQTEDGKGLALYFPAKELLQLLPEQGFSSSASAPVSPPQ